MHIHTQKYIYILSHTHKQFIKSDSSWPPLAVHLWAVPPSIPPMCPPSVQRPKMTASAHRLPSIGFQRSEWILEGGYTACKMLNTGTLVTMAGSSLGHCWSLAKTF